MSFQKEPTYTHGTIDKTAIVLVNLGTPAAPTVSAVRSFLRQFLSDARVVEIPKLIWYLILYCFILPFRPKKTMHKYEMIWSREGSPLKVHTEKQAALLRAALTKRGHDVQVAYAMRYGQSGLPEVLRTLKEQACERVVVFPLYPQYSGTTTASVFDAVFEHYAKVRNIPELRFVKHYHDQEAYIDALKESVLSYWAHHGRPDKLVMSFHGVPKRTLLLGDPYHCECYKTARLLAEKLQLSKDEYVVTFQSRFGKAEWLQPYTASTLQQLAEKGINRVDVLCPGFSSDCLETLEEIAIEAKREFLRAGGKEFHAIPCLNETPAWINAMAEIAQQHMMGWPTMAPSMQHEERKLAAQQSLNEARHLGAGQ